MAQFSFVLSFLAFLTAAIGAIYTYKVGRRQKLREEYDVEISEKVQEHPYLRNPVIIAILIWAALVSAYIIYLAMNSSW